MLLPALMPPLPKKKYKGSKKVKQKGDHRESRIANFVDLLPLDLEKINAWALKVLVDSSHLAGLCMSFALTEHGLRDIQDGLTPENPVFQLLVCYLHF